MLLEGLGVYFWSEFSYCVYVNSDSSKSSVLANVISTKITCTDPEGFVRGGPTNFDGFFKLMSGGKIQIPL